MFKSIITVSLRKMSSERKIKETLAKKLSGKKISRTTIQPKAETSEVEQAENKSQLFKDIKNEENLSKNKGKFKVATSKLGNIEASSQTLKSEQTKNDFIAGANKKVTVKRTSRTIKRELTDKIKCPLETKISKSSKVNNRTNISSKQTENKVIKKNEMLLKEQLDIASGSKNIKQELDNDNWQPCNWQITLENIRKMRANDKAPVDSMGCHKCADETADEKTQRFHKLVALMLSSQTKDETTYHAMLRLREHSLTPEVISNMKLNVLENILHPVSFYKNKAKYLQQTAKILIEKYNSDIPNNIKELVALPGVGPKMAHICMSTAWNQVTGIGVDVHVHRISNRLGWLPKPTKEPEQTRLALEAWLPQNLWSEVNYLLVGFGQTICTPVKPKCNECLNRDICPSATKVIKKEIIEANDEILNICDKVNFKKNKIKS